MKPTPKIEALDLVALSLEAHTLRGKAGHAKALKRLENAKQIWREQAIRKCPRCGWDL